MSSTLSTVVITGLKARRGVTGLVIAARYSTAL
ncbi:conserved domain protein [ [[Propionibacterium] namnetense SK182B-JCVI]|uniref:Conserved domain protein n=2 Tax=Cutibacterium namnetense TaxID=1574624 RepID=F9NSN0_9ACTN|nr:conserved domain protein [ [[Propionibacterium] namnetense SK182B-JCVI]